MFLIPLLRVYIKQYSSNAYSVPVPCTVQQCIQISTRINSSMYIVHTSFVSLETTFYLRVILQGFVDPIMQQLRRFPSFLEIHRIRSSEDNTLYTVSFALWRFAQLQCLWRRHNWYYLKWRVSLVLNGIGHYANLCSSSPATSFAWVCSTCLLEVFGFNCPADEDLMLMGE